MQYLTLLATALLSAASAASAKPALILVPGTFHRASVYDEVKTQLHAAGYPYIDAVDLPSNGYDVAAVQRTADTTAVTHIMQARLQAGDDVILVGNSYGATVIMEAVATFESYSINTPSSPPSDGKILGLIMVPPFNHPSMANS